MFNDYAWKYRKNMCTETVANSRNISLNLYFLPIFQLSQLKWIWHDKNTVESIVEIKAPKYLIYFLDRLKNTIGALGYLWFQPELENVTVNTS